MQPATPQRPPAEVNDAPTALNGPAAENGDFQSHYQGYELISPATTDDQTGTRSEGQSEIVWQASEYVHHEKDMGWFVLAGLATLVVTGIAIIFRQWTFAVLVIVMGAALIIYGRRPPRILHYSVGPSGVAVEQKEYTYEEFRSFGILQDGPLYSILLFPRKRFMPAVTMYFSESDGERIVDILGTHLPTEAVELELIDKLTRKLRF